MQGRSGRRCFKAAISWQLDGTRADSELEGRRRDVLDVLQESGKAMSANEIAEKLDMKAPHVTKMVNDLVDTGKVVQAGMRRNARLYVSKTPLEEVA